MVSEKMAWDRDEREFAAVDNGLVGVNRSAFLKIPNHNHPNKRKIKKSGPCGAAAGSPTPYSTCATSLPHTQPPQCPPPKKKA